jgi:hypothetical protein
MNQVSIVVTKYEDKLTVMSNAESDYDKKIGEIYSLMKSLGMDVNSFIIYLNENKDEKKVKISFVNI